MLSNPSDWSDYVSHSGPAPSSVGGLNVIARSPAIPAERRHHGSQHAPETCRQPLEGQLSLRL